MSTYKDLLKQREALEQQIAEARVREVAQALSQVHELIAEFELSPQEVFPPSKSGRSSVKAVSKVAPKYRNSATGETWTGRGKAPKWIEGQDRAQFVIA